jgi:hypothetical protein
MFRVSLVNLFPYGEYLTKYKGTSLGSLQCDMCSALSSETGPYKQ